MIPYHGTPITPEFDAARILSGRHAMVSFAHPEQIETVADICHSFALDNGAFSAWRSGRPITDWEPYQNWVASWATHPGFDFALIPDVIDGDESENDDLVEAWHLGNMGVPVWHMHESLARLGYLASSWPRVGIGSSGDFAVIGTNKWWSRMARAMEEVSDEQGRPKCKLHGLRMLDPEIFSRLPFASADSTNVARNIGLDSRWRGTYMPPSKAVRGLVLAERIEAHNSAGRWLGMIPEQEGLLALCE